MIQTNVVSQEEALARERERQEEQRKRDERKRNRQIFLKKAKLYLALAYLYCAFGYLIVGLFLHEAAGVSWHDGIAIYGGITLFIACVMHVVKNT